MKLNAKRTMRSLFAIGGILLLSACATGPNGNMQGMPCCAKMKCCEKMDCCKGKADGKKVGCPLSQDGSHQKGCCCDCCDKMDMNGAGK